MQISQNSKFKFNLNVNWELVGIMVSIQPVRDVSSIFTPTIEIDV